MWVVYRLLALSDLFLQAKLISCFLLLLGHLEHYWSWFSSILLLGYLSYQIPSFEFAIKHFLFVASLSCFYFCMMVRNLFVGMSIFWKSQSFFLSNAFSLFCRSFFPLLLGLYVLWFLLTLQQFFFRFISFIYNILAILLLPWSIRHNLFPFFWRICFLLWFNFSSFVLISVLFCYLFYHFYFVYGFSQVLVAVYLLPSMRYHILDLFYMLLFFY